MSLSRLERLQEQAEEERLSKLRAKQALETTDETKRRKKMIEEEQEQTRFAYKGPPLIGMLPPHGTPAAAPAPPGPHPLTPHSPDAALQDNVWYYRDRAGLPRGPCQLSTLRAGWVHGVIDEFTLVWGQGLEAWYPVRNVVSLVANIQSYDGESWRAPPAAATAPPLSSLHLLIGIVSLRVRGGENTSSQP